MQRATYRVVVTDDQGRLLRGGAKVVHFMDGVNPETMKADIEFDSGYYLVATPGATNVSIADWQVEHYDPKEEKEPEYTFSQSKLADLLRDLIDLYEEYDHDQDRAVTEILQDLIVLDELKKGELGDESSETA